MPIAHGSHKGLNDFFLFFDSGIEEEEEKKPSSFHLFSSLSS